MSQPEEANSPVMPTKPTTQTFTYADVVSENRSLEQLKTCHGKREMQEISIETVYEEGENMCKF